MQGLGWVGCASALILMNLQFDTHVEILNDDYKRRTLADLEANRAPTPITEKLPTNIRSFQKSINRTFVPQQKNLHIFELEVAF